jgi:ribonucleoside-diphosphate reductase beta chain
MMQTQRLTQIETSTDSLKICYPDAHKFQDLQQSGFWTANEVALEKDIQPLMTELTEAEKHGVLEVLKLFTLYELRADEFWSQEVKTMFPRPEIIELAQLFGAVELSVHRRVYDKLNQLLFLSNDEFYNSYKQSEVLKDRIDFLDKSLKSEDKLLKLATFSFMEGVILFSSFSYLMHFRANGKNKLPNIGLAIKFSARDEDTHAQASSWLFRTLREEMKKEGIQENPELEKKIQEIAEYVKEHEFEIVSRIFSKGKIEGITETQMQHFIESRIDVQLQRMGLKKLYNVKYNPIAEWFDKIVDSYQYTDFFAGQGSSYSRGWNSQGFVW